MKRSEIRELFVQAKDAYNSILGTDFNDKNLLLEFCTAKSAIKVFEKLYCTFPALSVLQSIYCRMVL